MANMKTVQDLLSDEIKDLYSAERQLTKAIPKMAKGSTDGTLQSAFSSTPDRNTGASEALGTGGGDARNQSRRQEMRWYAGVH